MKYMFHKCKNLKTINLFTFDTKNVTDMSDMFSFFENLKYLDLTSFSKQNVSDMSYMFCYCYNLNDLGLFNIENNKFIKQNYMYEMCINLDCFSFNDQNSDVINKYENEIILKIYVDQNYNNTTVYFSDNYRNSHDHLKELNKLNTKLYINDKKYGYKKYFIPEKCGEYIIKLKFNVELKDCSFMFAECKNIIEINFIKFNVKTVTNMEFMFYYC